MNWLRRAFAALTGLRAARREDTVAALVASQSEERREMLALVREIMAFKRDGFVPAPDRPVHIPQPDPIADAIRDASKGDSALARHFTTLSGSMKRAGTPDAEIIKVIAEYAE